jgi:hypothetical protein
MKRTLFFAFLLFTFEFSNAQQFGGNPSSVKWKQINTDTVRIIFPGGLEKKAQRVAAIIHTLQKEQSQTIGDAIRKVNIVLQNQTLLSNGYVALAPYRSEFYTTPPQNAFALGAVDWTDNLSVHEFRHVQQYSNFNKGLSKLATFILGEQGQTLANAMSVPDWFFEGDAVFNETKLTRQGRGQLPLFLAAYQSLSLANRSYSYMKMRNGSLRDYVPDHYALGYLLVAYGRKKYGPDIWRKITADAAAFKPLFYPFLGAVKKYTGISYNQFVSDVMKHFQYQWQISAKNILWKSSEKIEWLTDSIKHDVVNYQYPYPTEDGSWVVVKTSYSHIPAFYMIHPDKSEEKIAVKDISTDNYFSYNNGKIIYAALQPDVRWGNRNNHSVKVLDIKSGEETTLFYHTQYFSPDISHDGQSVLAVDYDLSGNTKIVSLNANAVITDSFSKKDIVFSYPKFSADDQSCYVTERNTAGEMALMKYALHNKEAPETLMPSSNRIIGCITVQRDTVLFTTTFEGRDELWAIIDGKEKRGPFRLASYVTGIYQGALQTDGNVVGSVFTANGYRLGKFEPLWQRVDIKDEIKDFYLNDVFKNDVFPLKDHLILDSVSQKEYAVSKYNKSFHLLNIHSFRPYYEQPEYSLTLYGQNVLNTLRSEIAYTYNQNEGSHKLGYNGIYGGSYLQPLFGISQTWQRTGALNKDTSLNWNEMVGYAGLQLPLNFSGGKQYRFLTLSSTYNIEKVSWTGIAQKLFPNRNFQYIQTRISYSGQIQKAIQQIYPHWAQNIFLQYKSVVNNYTAHQFLASGSLFLPGFANSHSIVLTAAYHERDTLQQYLFSNNFPFARGYSAVDFPRMWKIGVNYHFPLTYPDWGFGNIVYFQRIRANLFFDYTQGKSIRTGATFPFRTAGTELFFDTRWWNQQPVSFGIRYSRLLDNEFRGNTQPNVWELILPVNLFN